MASILNPSWKNGNVYEKGTYFKFPGKKNSLVEKGGLSKGASIFNSLGKKGAQILNYLGR